MHLSWAEAESLVRVTLSPPEEFCGAEQWPQRSCLRSFVLELGFLGDVDHEDSGSDRGNEIKSQFQETCVECTMVMGWRRQANLDTFKAASSCST